MRDSEGERQRGTPEAVTTEWGGLTRDGECSLAAMVPTAQEVRTGSVDTEEMVMLLEE